MNVVALKQVSAAWRSARRVLAVRLDNLGDVLMTTPALAAVRHSLPDAQLTLLASPSGAALAPHLPWLDDVITARVPWVKHPEGAQTIDPQALATEIARHRFDAAIIFTTYTQSALPAALVLQMAGIPLRLAHVRENPYRLLTHWVRDPEPAMVRHEVERQLALVAAVGMTAPDDHLHFHVRPQDFAAAQARLAAAGIDAEQPYLVVHPGASAPSRRYPAERFGEAVAQIARSHPWPVVYLAGADEAKLAATARRHAGPMTSVDFSGELALGELAAIIGNSRLLLANNSGPAHIAAALGTPVVDLYALTNPQHAPWRVAARVLNRDVPCRNCYSSVCPQGDHSCLRQVSSTEVAAAALELLDEQSAGQPTPVAAAA
jgi:lipopolysaccharide heptosyltransferase II